MSGICKKLVMALTVMSLIGCAGTPYVRGGIGLKFHENKITGAGVCESAISARGEVGVTYDYIVVGIAHHSQPLCGWPFNDKYERFKTEAFVDFYKEF